jgi:hypothetical protein
MSPQIFAAALAGLALPMLGHAGTCSRHSPAHTVALVELYTSEGCSSCPPADRWLGALPRRFSADEVVPLALHVDYWDYLGWRDPFAAPQFTARQRALSRSGGRNFVYTPAVFAGMKEFRGWSDHDGFAQRVRSINARPARADIALELDEAQRGTAALTARFRVPVAADRAADLQGIVVLYENRLTSEIRAGENRGETLRHDFVVRYWSAPVAIDPRDGRAELRADIDVPARWNRDRLGVAAFVQAAQSADVLQAVAMPGCSASSG